MSIFGNIFGGSQDGGYRGANAQAQGSSAYGANQGAGAGQNISAAEVARRLAAERDAYYRAQQNVLMQQNYDAARQAAINQQMHMLNQWIFAEPSKPTKPVEKAGLKLGEIIGYRVWRLKGDFLQSAYKDALWAPGEPMEGRPGDHDQNGVHAWATLRGALEYGHGDKGPRAYGRVALWGDVVEHERGYRAEFGRIYAIDGAIGVAITGPFLRRLRKTYAVDLKMAGKLRADDAA